MFMYTYARTVSAVNVLVFVIAVFQCSYYKVSLSSFQCFLCTIICAVLFALFQECWKMDLKQVKEAKLCKRGRRGFMVEILSGRTGFFLILFVSLVRLNALLELDLS